MSTSNRSAANSGGVFFPLLDKQRTRVPAVPHDKDTP